MGTKKWIIIGAVSVILLFSIVESNKDPNREEIKIGVVATLTGPGAFFGEQFVNGLQMAVQDINRDGGIDGEKIELIVEDSKTDNTAALNAVKKLVEVDKVSIILGDSWNGTTQTIQPYINEKKIVTVTPWASMDVFSADDYLFRLIPSTRDFMKPLAEYAYNNGIRTVGFAWAKGAFGEEHLNDFSNSFEELGGQVTIEESFDFKSTDVRSELTKIKSLNPDAIFNLHASGPSVGLLIAQGDSLGINTQYLGTWSVENDALKSDYGNQIEGIIYPFMFDENSFEKTKTFAKRARSEGKTMDFYIACGYDTLAVIVESIKKAGSTNSDAVKESLLKIDDFDGVSGRFGFDANGDVVREIRIKTFRDGEFIGVE